MKRNKIQIFLFFLIGINCVTYSQKKSNLEELIGFSCHSKVGNKESKPVLKVETKIIELKFEEISELLVSKNNAEKFMAVITLEKLVEWKKYKLSRIEENLINSIKKSDKYIYVCNGDSTPFLSKKKISELINGNYRKYVENWLEWKFKNEK